MCIAILKKCGKTISKETLKRCFDANSDGAGFAYVNTDFKNVKRLSIYKTLDFEKFWNKYERAERLFPESNFLIHFRIKTHGMVNIKNCHPFFINKDECFIHNGIIPGLTHSVDKSDTMMYNEEVLQHLEVGWHKNPGIKKLIESFIVGSKLVYLNVDNEFEIFNESKGTWVDDIWYSNNSYKEPVVYNTKFVAAKPSVVKKSVFGYGPVEKISGVSFDECLSCRTPNRLSLMSFYARPNRGITIYCKDCEEWLVDNNMLTKSDKVKLGDYLHEANLSKKSFNDFSHECEFHSYI
jgi:hypothetical protein